MEGFVYMNYYDTIVITLRKKKELLRHPGVDHRCTHATITGSAFVQTGRLFASGNTGSLQWRQLNWIIFSGRNV